MKALVVDDDLALADVVSFTMRRAGYEVIVAHDGLNAIERWQNESPEVIILDLNLPKLDGLRVCQRIRAQDETPIIILSVRGEEDDIVEGLRLGADDYMVKPFSPRQLVARIEAILRRSKGAPISQGPVTVGGFTFDPNRSEIHLHNGRTTRLTKLESRLLETLMINADQVMTFDQLIDHVWGPAAGDRPMLKQLIYRLRQKIETDPAKPIVIETIPAIGYTLNSFATISSSDKPSD